MSNEASLYRELNGALNRENYTKAIEICNSIRSKNADDMDAVKIKCIALIRLEKFEKALEIAIKYPNVLLGEQVYALYRLRRDTEALQALNLNMSNLSNIPSTLLHLGAQILYRKGEYQTVITIYEYLIEQANLHNEMDIIDELNTNLLAAYIASGHTSDIVQKEFSTRDSYEVPFNKSFLYLEQGDYQKAEECLVEAERIYQSMNEDSSLLDTNTMDIELVAIKMQLALIQQLSGNINNALASYRQLLKIKSVNGNFQLSIVANNNIVAIRKDRDLFDALKRLKASSDILIEKCSPMQHEILLGNRALLLSLMNKEEECQETMNELKKYFPNSSFLSELQVFALANGPTASDNQETLADSIQKLKDEANSSSTNVTKKLGLAHLYLMDKKPNQAADVIASISEIAHTPATVATLISLYEKTKDYNKAAKVFQNAHEYYQAKNGSLTDVEKSNLRKIQEGECRYQIQMKKYREAAEAYQRLLEDEGEDTDAETRLRSLASLVIALSFFDTAAAEARCALLPQVSECKEEPSTLITRAQESTRFMSNLRSINVTGDKKSERKRAAKNPEAIARKRLKRREAYLNSLRARDDYNPSIGLLNPDPERWIPRKQRSHGRRRGRGKNTNRFVGAQGSGMGTEKDAMRLDAAAKAAARKEAGTTTTIPTASSVMRKSKKKKRR